MNPPENEPEPKAATWDYTGPIYAHGIAWRGVGIFCHGYMSPKDAREAAMRAARNSGWVPRRWWQFWR